MLLWLGLVGQFIVAIAVIVLVVTSDSIISDNRWEWLFCSSILSFFSESCGDYNFWVYFSLSRADCYSHHVLLFIPDPVQACHTKAEYEEYGASICRTNPVFKGMY